MANYSDICKRWAERATGETDKAPLGSGYSRGNVYERDGKVYSYGSHFEMGRLVKPGPRSGVAPFFLLNGDSYSNTTTRHQSYVRAAVHATGLASVLIPHTAMERAGIDLDTIVPVDVMPETNETIPHTVTVPGLAELGERAASGGFGWDDSNARRIIGGRDVLTGNDTGTPGALTARAELVHEGATYSVNACKRGVEYVLCEDEQYRSEWRDYDPPKVSYYRNGAGLAHVEGDTFTYDTYRHWLGGCVFSAKVTEHAWRQCKTHGERTDANPETRRYGTYDKPTANPEWCEDCGGLVTYDEDGNVETPRPYRVPVMRRAWFVSGWDENERRPLYFLAELPAKARPTTYAEALHALAPPEVHAAIAAGLPVVRQGDIFAVPCTGDDHPPRIAARYAEKRVPVPLDGTRRHIAGELVTCADGGHERVYARGTMRHAGGDHAQLRLGGNWHRLYRNTVPMRKTSGPYPGADPGTVRAWTIAGRVD